MNITIRVPEKVLSEVSLMKVIHTCVGRGEGHKKEWCYDALRLPTEGRHYQLQAKRRETGQ